MSEDLDQGGSSRMWIRVYRGPSLGWLDMIDASVVMVTAGGTHNIPVGTTLVAINSLASPTIQLPSAVSPQDQPIRLGGQPVTIADIGGHALAAPITILPAMGETILGIASLAIANNWGSFTLVPNEIIGGWAQQ